MDGGSSSPGGTVQNNIHSSIGTGQLPGAGSGAGAVSKRAVFNFHMGSSSSNKSRSGNGSRSALVPGVRRKQVNAVGAAEVPAEKATPETVAAKIRPPD